MYPRFAPKMRSMSKKPDAYLKIRGENSYYSIVVNIPTELRVYYPRKTGGLKDKIIEALGTSNKIKAQMLRDKRVAEILLEFEDLRCSSDSSKPMLSEVIRTQLQSIEEARHSGNKSSLSSLEAGLDMIHEHYSDNRNNYSTQEDAVGLAEVSYEAYGTTSITFIAEEFLKYHYSFSKSMKQKVRRYAKRLISFLGNDTSPDSVSNTQARAFIRDLNQQTKWGYQVKKDTAGGLDSLWRWAKRHGMVSDNIFEGAREDIHVGNVGKPKPRHPFSDQDVIDVIEGLHKLNKSQVMLSALTLMGLFTGVRIAELAGLKVGHILDGHILDIVAGKNHAAVRRIPTHRVLHPLIDKLIQTSTDGWLIPDFPNRKTPRGDSASRAFSAYKQELWGSNARPKLTFHSFRHRMEDLFRNAKILPASSRRLTGRTGDGSEDGYGKGVTIVDMQEALDTIQQSQGVDEAVARLLDKILLG